MPADHHSIIERLTSISDDIATNDALAWLDNNPTHADVKALIVSLERFSTAQDVVERCAEWLLKHPEQLIPPTDPKAHALEPFGSTHSQYLIKYQALANNLNIGSKPALLELLNSLPTPPVISLCIKWLDTFADNDTDKEMITNLLLAAPTPEICARAKALQVKVINPMDKSNLLSNLIRYNESPALVQEALQILADNDDFDTNEFLAEAIINSNCNDESKQTAIDWWHKARRARRKKSSNYSLSFGALQVPSIAAATISEIKVCINEEAQFMTWIALQIKSCTESTIAECWQWLDANRNHKHWENLFWHLLSRASRNHQQLPAAALEQLWVFVRSEHTDYASFLLAFDSSEPTIDYLYALAKSEAKQNEPIDDLLAGLIKADPSEDKIDFAISWIESQLNSNNSISETVEALLEVMQTNRLREIAHGELIDQEYQTWYLSKLLRTVELLRNDWSIKLARIYLERECRYGIRAMMAHECAPLIELLLEIDRDESRNNNNNNNNNNSDSDRSSIETTRSQAEQWLQQFAHMHKAASEKLRQALSM
ncbi:MAG: hypothetical protein IPL73_12355 [Candidatus Obscuribacter sp.]|nr:hypothetical protein [Candidatus Obscuribacter sp.]